MQILHLDTELTWRGGENQIRLLVEGLRGSEAFCTVAVRPASLAAKRLAHAADVETVGMRGGFDLGAAWRLAQICDRRNIQLIDCHTSNSHSLALLVKRLRPKLRLIVHRRVDYPPKSTWFGRKKYLDPRIDRFVAISSAIRDVLVQFGVPAARIEVVKSAVPTSGYRDEDRPAARAELAKVYGIDPAQTFIGNASALTPQKGYEVLLDAAALLKTQQLPFHIFIAGDGELTSALERQRMALGLEHHVTFLGFIEQVGTFLSSLDILAVSSRDEGLGTILLEGIGAGLAVAATRVGGIPEIIRHGDTGLLSPSGDAAALAANLTTLALNPSLRRTLVANARAHIARDFSVSAMVQGNLAVYRRLLSQ